MKVCQKVLCLSQLALVAFALAKEPGTQTLSRDVKVASKIDTKSIDMDLTKNEVVEKDTKVAKYASKEHPKSKSGMVTEIKPANDKKKTADGLVEEAPPYMKDVKDSNTMKSIAGDKKGEKSGSDENAEPSDQWHSFIVSLSMIVVSEIGDKTFLIAALMAMRSPRLVVFSAAASALVVMTVLSGIVGHALPALIPQRVTQFLAGLLFVVFGYRLLREGMEMSNEVGVNDEMAEVEEEIALSSINDKNNDIEAGAVGASVPPHNTVFQKYLHEFKQLVSFVLSPTWVQVFVLTFLGEWGDRSQIATIALAAGSNYWFTILGGCVGHTFCTAIAVLGGMFLASRISMKKVTLGGAATFFIFAILYLYEAIYGEH